MSTAGLYVTIHKGGGAYKHWRLHIEGPSERENIIYQIMGSSTRYRFETRQENCRQAEDLIEMIFLCDVDVGEIGTIEKLARAAVIHNEAPGYNCQDYVLELLDALEERRVVDGEEEGYRRSKKIVRGKVEGLIRLRDFSVSISS